MEEMQIEDDMQSELEEAFTRAVRVHMRSAYLIDGVIKSVEYPDSYTCTVSVGTAPDEPVDFNNVALRVLWTNQASFLELPTVGSKCIICFRDGNMGRRQLFAADTCDKLLMNYPLIQANGGKNGGLINVVPLVERFNLIEQDINNLKSAFASWIVVPDDGGAALKAIAAGWYGQELAETTREEIEDTTVTH